MAKFLAEETRGWYYDWSAIDREWNQVRITTGRTGKLLILPLAQALRKHIESIPNGSGPIHACCINRPGVRAHRSSFEPVHRDPRTRRLA
jgi:hypothetical protein